MTTEIKTIKEDNQIVEFQSFEFKLAEFKNKYDNMVYNLSDPVQEKAAKSDRLAIGKVIATLDKKHKEIKEPIKKQSDLIDGERKRIKDDLLAVQDKIKSQIKAHEDKIKAHHKMLDNKVQQLVEMSVLRADQYNSVSVKSIINTLQAIEIDDSFENRKADAALAKMESLEVLNKHYIFVLEEEEKEKVRLENERINELARQKKREAEIIEREKIIAENKAQKAIDEEKERSRIAEKQAEMKAKRLLNEANAKLEKAKMDKIEADKRAKLAVENERKKIQAELIAAQKKKDLLAIQEEELKRDKKHRDKIYFEIKDDLTKEGFTIENIKNLLNLIKSGKVRHIKIEY